MLNRSISGSQNFLWDYRIQGFETVFCDHSLKPALLHMTHFTISSPTTVLVSQRQIYWCISFELINVIIGFQASFFF